MAKLNLMLPCSIDFLLKALTSFCR